MSIEYRQITADEHRAFSVTVERGFGNHYEPSDERYEIDKKVLAPETTLAAFDGGDIVGTSAALPFETGVPGGAMVRNAGVTAVTVSTTHRRRGLLTEMMNRLLRKERDKGQPVASLWASESGIYGRFGFGMSIQHENFRIDSRQAALKHMPEVPGRIKFVSHEEARRSLPAAWEAAVQVRAGIPRRNNASWDGYALELNESRGGWSKPFIVVYEEDGRQLGYARYMVRELDAFTEQMHGVVNAHDVVHSTPASHAALWNHLLNIDLYDRVSTWRSPSDDGLSWMLADPGQLQRMPYDGVWYRLLDVAGALAARTYLTGGNLVFEVVDPFVPEWGGRFELTGGPDGATCTATTRSADIVLPTSSLAAVYLGGARLAHLQRAGRVQEDTDGSVALADAMFTAVRAPWCPMMF